MRRETAWALATFVAFAIWGLVAAVIVGTWL